mgnify:CR=1 FL=1
MEENGDHWIVLSDITASIALLLVMLISMLGATTNSMRMAQAGGPDTRPKQKLELSVGRDGQISVTAGDTGADVADITIDGRARAMDYEEALAVFLMEKTAVKATRRIVGGVKD